METIWLRDALFGGMTADAFKLGTVLTSGWFWCRVNGCSVLYRGESMEQVDFDNILAVDEKQAEVVSPPDYIQHNSNTTYFYVIRRVNNCGLQESSLDGAVKVSIDDGGDLAAAQPNDIFGIKVERKDSNKVRLTWYYCPIGQQSSPGCFKIYYDGGTGQIDYQNPIATLCYCDRRFYSYQSDTLSAGRYLFAIRVEDAIGTANKSFARVEVQIHAPNVDAISILSAGPT
jgi:hypothetical protein